MNTIWRPDLVNFPGPKYKALAAALRDGVRQGALKPGAKLPPVRELAYQLEITPGTVARAYGLLTDAGVFEATVGRGTFVAQPRMAGPDTGYIPPQIEVDGVPHGSGGLTGDISLVSPALPDMGQAGLIRRLMGDIAQDPPSGLMHYPNRAMFRPAREAAVRWLEGTPLGGLDQDDIVFSHGGQNGITLVLQTVLRGSAPVVLVEDLAYPGFRRAAELLRAQVVAVTMDEDGIVPDAFEQAVRTHGAQVLCTSPEVHNPTGIFTTPERRAALVEIARRHDVQILEDDCYRMGRARAPSYRMLAPERGWYVSSISKTLTPALRIGFAIAPQGQGAWLRRTAEHGFFGLAAPLADLAARLLVAPEIDRCADAVVQRFGVYIREAINHLGRFDIRWREDVPFFWLQLPKGWRASAFCQAAASEGVRIRPAEDFAERDARAPHAVRIAVNAQIPLERFCMAMTVLRDLLDNPPERIGV